MAYQRSIAATMHKGWQPYAGDSQVLAKSDPRRNSMHPGMLREDSAYEMYPGYRNAIRGVSRLWY